MTLRRAIAKRLTRRQAFGYAGFVALGIIVAALLIWRSDIVWAGFDPEMPFQTYDPPPAADYGEAEGWLIRESRPLNTGDAVAVFFVHPTTQDARREWLGKIGESSGDAYFRSIVVPNYVAPFARHGSISAPRYRQASLYSRMSNSRDSIEARLFAYADVERAFDAWLARHPDGPVVLAGVEQGADLIALLLQRRVEPDDALRRRLVAAYGMGTLQVAATFEEAASVPACRVRAQTGCFVAWFAVAEGDDGAERRRIRRAVVWDGARDLVGLAGRPILCVNPVTGSVSDTTTTARQHLGGANATGLEWGARPALLSRQIATQCRDGLLRYTRPLSDAFRLQGSWADRRKAAPYNLFYADIEADMAARSQAWRAQNTVGVNPMVDPPASRTVPPAA